MSQSFYCTQYKCQTIIQGVQEYKGVELLRCGSEDEEKNDGKSALARLDHLVAHDNFVLTMGKL